MRYASNADLILQGYVDAYWVGNEIDRKRTSGCCFTLGLTMVSWCSIKQISVDLITVEADYITSSVAVHE
jgi:hypothetical protein